MPAHIIDIHSHILPGVDDGAADWDESRQMLTIAYEHGIRTIVATPHFSRKQNIGHLRELAEQLSEEAKRIDPDFRICLGQEIMYFDSMIEYLKRGDALTLAGTRYVLVEFFPGVTYSNLYQWARKIIMAGYLPVIAHVERYHVLRDENKFEELAATGCYMQMNYSSLEGLVFHSNTRWCRNRILDTKIHFLSTDMHHSTHRAPDIHKSLGWLDKNASPEYKQAVTYKHAAHLLDNRQI